MTQRIVPAMQAAGRAPFAPKRPRESLRERWIGVHHPPAIA